MNNPKRCFVIAPIGADGSPTRQRSDQVFTHVIEPVARECGYSEVVRADHILTPGIITAQIVRHILEDDMVIADLTGHNANVFYELAVRHVIGRPVVQMMQMDEGVPFDLAGLRTIFLNYQDLDSVQKAKRELRRQMRVAEEDSQSLENPVSMALAMSPELGASFNRGGYSSASPVVSG